jgi:hypothetical protein
MSNTDYLYKQLIEINKKYESTTFIDIDFIELFSIRSINIDEAKKKITNKYYNLALKYHPDKYTNVTDIDQLIDINNILVNIDDIKSGQFLSFITDIYKILITMITEDKENLKRIIEGCDILSMNYGGDHTSLKQHFNSRSYDIPNAYTEVLNNEVISEIKIDDKELQKLIDIQVEKRKELNIEQIFTENDIKSEGFKNTFNDKFETTIVNSNVQTEILPYNELNKNIGLKTSISDIKEAFEPIQINRRQQSKIISFEEIISRRQTEYDTFKVAKNFKKDSD